MQDMILRPRRMRSTTMADQGSRCEVVRDGLLDELTDAALRVGSRHGVKGFSVDQEIGLWRRLGEVLARLKRGSERDRTAQDVFSAELAQAAYEVALENGFRGSFLDVQLDYWRTLRQVAREGTWSEPFWNALRRRSQGMKGPGERNRQVAVA